ncbi:PilZ domain-containing protein [Myxococcota bacterium]|nr:PilZ domain-containing protein [Myxococcota bacterium]
MLDGRSSERPSPLLRDQRKSARFEAALGVQLVYGGVRELVRTTDVSFHGLFVSMERPPPARMMVELTIYLPDGPIPASAFVARRVERATSIVPGAGLQLFAVGASAKARWDRFLRALGDERSTQPGDLHHVPRDADRPTFLLKLRDEARLRELFERNVRTGEVYLATPVIKEPGTEVALIVIHPRTEQELLLSGRVVRVRRERPKGMEIHLEPPLAPDVLATIERFVETGIAPEAPRPETPPVEPPKPFDLLIEEPVPYGDVADFDWSDVSQSMVLDFDLRDVTPIFEQLPPTGDDFVVEPEVRDAADETTRPPEPDPSEPVVPIALDPTAVGPSLRAQDELERRLRLEATRAPTSEGPPISIDLDEEDVEAPDDPPSISVDLEPVDPLLPGTLLTAPPLAPSARVGDGPTSDLDPDAGRPRTVEVPTDRSFFDPPVTVRVECTRCSAPSFTIELGSPPGPLGLLARRRPFYCERCDTYVSVLRMKPADERRRVREAIWLADSRALEHSVSIELLFEVAALANSTARCPVCGGAGRTNATTEALAAAAPRLDAPTPVVLDRATCGACGERALVAVRVHGHR